MDKFLSIITLICFMIAGFSTLVLVLEGISILLTGKLLWM